MHFIYVLAFWQDALINNHDNENDDATTIFISLHNTKHGSMQDLCKEFTNY